MGACDLLTRQIDAIDRLRHRMVCSYVWLCVKCAATQQPSDWDDLFDSKDLHGGPEAIRRAHGDEPGIWLALRFELDAVHHDELSGLRDRT
jgi:hypothetical protein